MAFDLHCRNEEQYGPYGLNMAAYRSLRNLAFLPETPKEESCTDHAYLKHATDSNHERGILHVFLTCLKKASRLLPHWNRLHSSDVACGDPPTNWLSC